uniref:Bestrophin homolog n=1 Tax=Acrobeloides nanus TaxID=290746 RepID=A0A914CVE5_9BILA
MYRETCVFLLAYYLIAFIYRYTLPPYFQRQFEKISLYCREFTTLVPITFVLGFYVTFVVGRWWQQYNAIPWPDRLAIQISTYIQGTDDRARMIRRSLIRYANLTALLTFQNTSTVIKQRFPTVNHLVEAGLLTPEEKEELESVVAPHGNWWVPSHWFAQLVAIARKEGRIHDDLHYKSLIDEMLTYRGLCGTVWSYDWISVPLVYTQVVTIAVYSFFFSCLFGRQYLEPYKSEVDIDRNAVDYYFPLFTIFQFVFYVGWLKVAESMICPFGEDDDDFDMNWIIDRNIQVSYLIVDKLFRKFPKLTKDVFWDDVDPELPYTQASSSHRGVPFYGSTVAMSISERNAEWNFPETMPPIDEEAKITSGRHASKHTKDRKFYSAQNSIDANQHKSLFNRATSEQNDKPVMSHGSLSIIDQDDEEDVSIHSSNEDIRSNGSRL